MFTRRSFLGTLVSSLVALLGLRGPGRRRGTGRAVESIFITTPAHAGTKPVSPPRVVISRDMNVVTSTGTGDGNRIDRRILGKMLDRAMEKLTDAGSSEAWSVLFSPDDVVGIKVNCLAGRGLSPHTELVDLITERLAAAGVSRDHIIVWDRTDRDLERAGFRINRKGDGCRCYGTNNDYPTDELEFAGSVGCIFSPILSKYATAIINVPVMKDHDLAGVTLSMKNFYGAIHNPNKYHDNNCSPYVADLNTHRFIKDKLRLIITDALTAQYHGGPSFKPEHCWNYSGLIAARDQVAHDTIGWKIIEEKRKAAGKASLAESKREPSYIKQAGERGLGESDPARIEVIET